MPRGTPVDRSPLVNRDLAVLWHPCGQQRDYQAFPPLEVVGAEGCRISLADGRTLLDAISSWWCKSLGHGHPRLRAALIAQAGAFEHVILANTTNEGVVRLSERLCRWCDPDGDPSGRATRASRFTRVFYAGDGSTGVEVAIKMAIQAQRQRGQPRRTRLAALAGGYHGESIATLSVSDCGLYKEPFIPLLFPCTMLGPMPYRSGPGDPRWGDAASEWVAIERLLEPIADQLAAIIYEPLLQAAGGMRLYSPDLLTRLGRWAHQHGVLLIADEIASGMGRLGTALASHQAGTQPDVIVLSKGLTGGFLPLSAVVTTEALYDLFLGDYRERRAFLHSNTFCGNALAVAVANAVLDVFAEEDLLARVAITARGLRERMAVAVDSRPYLTNLRSLGMMAAVDLTARDGAALRPQDRTGWQVFQEAVARGALLRPLGDTMYLLPPLTATPAEIEEMVAILLASVETVLAR